MWTSTTCLVALVAVTTAQFGPPPPTILMPIPQNTVQSCQEWSQCQQRMSGRAQQCAQWLQLQSTNQSYSECQRKAFGITAAHYKQSTARYEQLAKCGMDMTWKKECPTFVASSTSRAKRTSPPIIDMFAYPPRTTPCDEVLADSCWQYRLPCDLAELCDACALASPLAEELARVHVDNVRLTMGDDKCAEELKRTTYPYYGGPMPMPTASGFGSQMMGPDAVFGPNGLPIQGPGPVRQPDVPFIGPRPAHPPQNFLPLMGPGPVVINQQPGEPFMGPGPQVPHSRIPMGPGPVIVPGLNRPFNVGPSGGDNSQDVPTL